MKLQRQKAYKYKDKTYYKYVLIIPEKTISELGWEDGQELGSQIEGTKLILNLSKNL